MTPKEHAEYDRNRAAFSAAKILGHYFDAVLPPDPAGDRFAEIRAAVDFIVEAATANVAASIAEPVKDTPPKSVAGRAASMLREVSEREGWTTFTENDVLCAFVDGIIGTARVTELQFAAYLESRAARLDDSDGS